MRAVAQAVAGVMQRGARTLASTRGAATASAGKALGLAAAVDAGMQAVGFAIGAPMRTEKHYDLFGTGSFAAVVFTSLGASASNAGVREVIASCCVAAWALRLGQFLFRRVLSEGKDSRFDGVRDNPPKFALFWAVQALWVFITPLSVTLLNAYAPSHAALLWTDIVGFSIFASGFALEWIAGVLSDASLLSA